ncbi:class I SAM-dependent methyltransferase [Streptomyces sclerotialus]|uniref:class I SAM-dependent methyltransferase n=1 Tax=Streptomyces sclerotialus TaxID=1957 RepID=UPI0007C4350C
MTSAETRTDNRAAPLPEQVGATYDKFGPLFSLILGDSAIHVGSWADPADHGERTSATSLPELANQAMTRQTDRYIGLLRPRAGQRVLDIGCGTGGPAVRLARSSGAQVTGITVSGCQATTATELALSTGLHGQVSFDHGDAMQLPYSADSFDAALAIDSLCHMNDRPRALREAYRVLRPGGLLLLTEFTASGSPSREQLDTYHAVWATGPLLSPGEVLEMAEQVGFIAERMENDTHNASMTGELMRLLYHDRHDAVLSHFGQETTAQIDALMPALCAFTHDHLGHYIFLLSKPRASRSTPPGSSNGAGSL